MNEKYKASNGFIKRTIAGETVLVPVGATTQSFNGMIMLNDSGAYLWDLLSEAKSMEELAAEMKKEFDASEEEITADINEFLRTGIDEELIQII